MKNINISVTKIYILSLVLMCVMSYLSYININLLIPLLIGSLFISFIYISSLREIKKINENMENEKIQNNLNLSELDDSILDEIVSVTKNSANNIFVKRIKLDSKNKKYLQIAENINITLENFQLTINNILEYLNDYQKNNFTKALKSDNAEELKPLIDGINNLNIKISRMLLSSLKSGIRLRENSDLLKENINQLTNNLTTQAATLEETASAVEEITSSVINNNVNVDEMLVNSEKLIKFVNNGYQSAQNSALLMDAINEKTKSIEDAIVIIDQIAFQTNILSLNAAVEAATAGEAGRGFAVVAQEVRNLASRAAEAAKEIKQLVGSATNETNKGKIASSEMIREYDILNENIINTKSLMEDISSSLKEQQKGIEQINRAISQIDFATQENASSAQDTMKIAIQNDNMANTMVIETNKTNFFGRDEYNNLLKQKI